MATMFRNFSFAPASPPLYSVYEAERAAMNVSPTSGARPPIQLPDRPLTPPYTMGDLAVQLKQQSLRIDTNVRCCYPAGPLTPGSDGDGNDGASPTEQARQERPTYSRVAASLLRMQRQQSSRIQYSPSHVRDISKLVKMLEQEEQCTVSESSSRTSSTSTLSTWASPTDDEGVDMDYDMPAPTTETLADIPTRRSGDQRESCIRVTKPVRMRKRSKENRVCKRRS
ncbi:hypothetical protein BDW02DRAFT_572291 [Decorospora gaudefroyi]|uniref:Uncharacterized protein n=1 Tax=Decorospora gaudefroyi TaxID=184978 RepID=A0A6A5K2C0_9PLEO|nr:hypothetical protein BDW02DRAFT_572291 [Decorospora gaudefroyi]